jgi:hypothetical protein
MEREFVQDFDGEKADEKQSLKEKLWKEKNYLLMIDLLL